ncbi:MAG: lytic transglycosylase domain-containing protein [Clostridia bacterium]|nr:lytic transglycosylase domain-containing protein [Clostridia bacterium]
MNTFPPPPEMRPGGYQNLPPRNPRSGRTQQEKTKKATHAAKGNRHGVHTSNGLTALFPRPQLICLGVLAALFAIALLFFLVYEGQCSAIAARHNHLLNERAARERAYQQNVASHKTDYRDLVEYYAAVNQIDPAFVAAIIKRESDYDPRAVSRVGARGLMQIMPDTGEWLAGKVDAYDYSPDMLFDPETNIKMGCWYLGYLSRKFGGDPITIACAYHAGQGNVEDHWLPKYAANGKTLTLDEIPMDDTKYYARKVLEAYAIYQQHHY